MDCAGMFTIIFRVYGPLLKPPIVALIIELLGVWNDYLWPALTISGNPDYYPLPTGSNM
jgi:ABC-type glycerol-3-phosphate transport system permease component